MTWSDWPIWPTPYAQNDKLHVGAQFIAPSRHTTQALINERPDVGAVPQCPIHCAWGHGWAPQQGAIHCAATLIVLSNQHHKRGCNYHAL